MLSVYFDPDLNDDGRRAKLYAGDIIILSPTAGTTALVCLLRDRCSRRLSSRMIRARSTST